MGERKDRDFGPGIEIVEDAAPEMEAVAAIQRGGSKGDTEVIAACNEHNIAMIFTGRRHFKH